MPLKSELFSPVSSTVWRNTADRDSATKLSGLVEIGIVFALILAAIWTHQGRLNLVLSISALVCVVAFAIAGKFNARAMGLTRPIAGAAYIFFAGALACGVVAALGAALPKVSPPYGVPFERSWEYAIRAMEQEFILQSIFFVRLENAFGSRRAIVAAAALFALAHIPNPILTPLAFLGAILFCELFRRWRNLLPIGIVHAALGLTIAASFPDAWLHHMRVGIGYFVHG